MVVAEVLVLDRESALAAEEGAVTSRIVVEVTVSEAVMNASLTIAGNLDLIADGPATSRIVEIADMRIEEEVGILAADPLRTNSILEERRVDLMLFHSVIWVMTTVLAQEAEVPVALAEEVDLEAMMVGGRLTAKKLEQWQYILHTLTVYQ